MSCQTHVYAVAHLDRWDHKPCHPGRLRVDCRNVCMSACTDTATHCKDRYQCRTRAAVAAASCRRGYRLPVACGNATLTLFPASFLRIPVSSHNMPPPLIRGCRDRLQSRCIMCMSIISYCAAVRVHRTWATVLARAHGANCTAWPGLPGMPSLSKPGSLVPIVGDHVVSYTPTRCCHFRPALV